MSYLQALPDNFVGRFKITVLCISGKELLLFKKPNHNWTLPFVVQQQNNSPTTAQTMLCKNNVYCQQPQLNLLGKWYLPDSNDGLVAFTLPIERRNVVVKPEKLYLESCWHPFIKLREISIDRICLHLFQQYVKAEVSSQLLA